VNGNVCSDNRAEEEGRGGEIAARKKERGGPRSRRKRVTKRRKILVILDGIKRQSNQASEEDRKLQKKHYLKHSRLIADAIYPGGRGGLRKSDRRSETNKDNQACPIREAKNGRVKLLIGLGDMLREVARRVNTFYGTKRRKKRHGHRKGTGSVLGDER